uniref:Uncharacterized protein LOC104233110 n=1 Tax=Nicotiana sylvestris TaxID=4096 RepID=A0A1U7XE39_NICSY
MIEDCGLVDLCFYGPKYTWSNGTGQGSIIWKRLDRGIVNDQRLAACPTTTVSHLASTGSYHNPLLMEINVRQDTGNKYFRFLNFWIDNVNFKPFVKDIWDKQVNRSVMWVFHQKLKALCTGISKWSRQEYGDISMNPTSSARPDGFNGKFYQSYWDIIKNDLLNIVLDFFGGC